MARTKKDADARIKMIASAPGRQQMAMTSPRRNATISSSALRQIKEDGPAIRRKRRNRAQTDKAWQIECFEYAEKVGELGALLTLQSNIVSLCAFPVRRWDPDESDWIANDPDFEDKPDAPVIEAPKAPIPPELAGTVAEKPKAEPPKPDPKAKQRKTPDYDDRPANVMRAFVGPDGGQVDLIRRAAYNLFCAGDCTLTGTPHPKDTGILWEFLSVRELYPNADGAMVRRRGGVGTMEEPLPDDNYTGRLFMSDVAFSDMATSEVKRVLPILQEIVTLTMMVDAIAKSRVPAGILFIPQGFSFAGSSPESNDAETADEGDIDDDETTILVDEVFDHVTAPFSDNSSAARIVPLIITGPLPENGNGRSGIEVIDLSRSFDAFAMDLRKEALGRLANGLDAPPEAMTGKASLSHWTAANVDSEFIVKHIQPIGIRIADFLTEAYLHPMLEAYENMSKEEAAEFKVEFDPSPVIARADEAKSARDLREWLSDDALLMANGFTKADMASEETIRVRRLWTLVSTQSGQFGKLLPLLPGFENVDPELIGKTLPAALGPADPNAPQGTDPNAPPPNQKTTGGKPAPDDGKEKSTGNETPNAKTKPGNTQEPKADAAKMSNLVERLTTAADAAVGRALERAGSRVISLSRSKAPELHARLAATRKDRMMSLVTTADLTQFSLTPKRLLDHAWDDLAMQSREWISMHLVANDVDEMQADDRAALASHLLCERLQEMVETKMLSQWRSGSNGLRVPNSLVNEVLEQAAYAGAL